MTNRVAIFLQQLFIEAIVAADSLQAITVKYHHFSFFPHYYFSHSLSGIFLFILLVPLTF